MYMCILTFLSREKGDRHPNLLPPPPPQQPVHQAVRGHDLPLGLPLLAGVALLSPLRFALDIYIFGPAGFAAALLTGEWLTKLTAICVPMVSRDFHICSYPVIRVAWLLLVSRPSEYNKRNGMQRNATKCNEMQCPLFPTSPPLRAASLPALLKYLALPSIPMS